MTSKALSNHYFYKRPVEMFVKTLMEVAYLTFFIKNTYFSLFFFNVKTCIYDD